MSREATEESDVKEKQQETTRQIATRNKSLYPLPDVNHSFETQIKILRACVVASDYGKRDSSLEQVQNVLVSKSGAIGNAISFFASIGLVSGDRNNFRPTGKAVDFIYASKNEGNGNANLILGEVIREAWFAKSARELIEVMGPVSESDLIGRMVRDCRVDPDKRERSFKSLIEYLRYTRIISEQPDGKLAIVKDPAVKREEVSPFDPKPTSLTDGGREDGIGDQQSNLHSISRQLPFAINLNIEISQNTDVEKLRQIIKTIREEFTDYCSNK